jgi:two-component system, OmpR family, sensor histidine kinase PrrB
VRAPSSLRVRIVLAALAAVTLVGLVAGGALLTAIAHDGRTAVDRDLSVRAQMLAHRIVDESRGYGGPMGGGMGGGPPDESLLSGSGTFVQVARRDQVVAQAGDLPSKIPAPPSDDGLSTVHIAGHQWRSLAFTVDPVDGTRVQVATSLAPVEARVARIRRIVLLVGLLALGLTALTAWFLTGLAIRPLARLRAGAARVSDTADLSERLDDADGPVEVRSLAGDLNQMLGRLQASTDATRRFAADAGHELRTPLTGLRANLETLQRNPELPAGQRGALLGEMAAEQDRMVHLLEGLQALARGEAANAIAREDVELGDMVDAAVFSARRRHPETTIELGEEGEVVVHGWADGLRRVVDNLLDNAALHGRPGGRVVVSLRREDGRALLSVDDDGPGVPEAERPRALEPFARGEGTDAPGTGLGLAIVAQQVALHDGALELTESPLGGLGVRVRLPGASS